METAAFKEQDYYKQRIFQVNDVVKTNEGQKEQTSSYKIK